MFKVRPQDNVVLESCHGCFQIPIRMGEKRRCAFALRFTAMFSPSSSRTSRTNPRAAWTRELLIPVGRAPRARRKRPTTLPTSAVPNQILPWPTLPAASVPSCDSRHRLVSCTNPQARISTPATDAFQARTTTTRCHRKISPTALPKLLQLLHLSHNRHSLPDQSAPNPHPSP